MFLVYKKGQNAYAKNLDSIQTFAVQANEVIDYYQNTKFGIYESNEEAIARFDDAVEAAAEGQTIYDFRNEVGYWKPKKVGRKPKAEQSAPAEHTPTPKK